MNMEKAIFFPSIEGDRKYSAQDLADTIGGLVTNGVYSRTATNLKAEAAGGMNIKLHPGLCVINGRIGINKNPVTLTGDAADGVLNRIDRVVIRCDYNTRQFVEYIKKGTPASSPTAPALQRDADAHEISVADYVMAAGTAEITQLMIIDTRASSILCGYVDFAPNPGLSGLFAETQAKIDALLAGLDLGNLPASAITSGVFDLARLPGANTESAGVARLNSAVDSILETQAATPLAIKTVNDKAVLLQEANAVLNTGGAAPNFTVTDVKVTGYAAALRRTIKFHAAGTAATLNFNGLGARAIYEYTGKAASVKAGQVVTVWYDGANFFTVSGGGGVSLPETIAGGETVIYPRYIECGIGFNGGAEYDLPTGYGVTCVKAGTYRFKYYFRANRASSVRLTKNGGAVSGSDITISSSTNGVAYEKVIDVPLVAGDIVKLRGIGYGGAPPYTDTVLQAFIVAILANDIQAELNKAVTPV